MKNPEMTVPFINQGGIDAMIGRDGVSIPITIVGDRLGTASAKVTVEGPVLYARQTASPFKARPFMENAVITSPTNTINATADIPNADAVKFRNGETVTYYDVSAGAIASQTLPINTVGAADSGGAGLVLITFTGVWGAAPAANDLLVLPDGTELSANVVVVLDDIEFDGTTELASNGFVSGVFKKAEVNNNSRFVQASNPGVQLIDIQ